MSPAEPRAARNDNNFAIPPAPGRGWEETGAESAPTVQPPAIKRGVAKLWRIARTAARPHGRDPHHPVHRGLDAGGARKGRPATRPKPAGAATHASRAPTEIRQESL